MGRLNLKQKKKRIKKKARPKKYKKQLNFRVELYDNSKRPINALFRTVGVRLREWRKSRQLTLQMLARILGTSQGSLSDIENGVSFPSYPTLAKLRHFFPRTDWMRIFFW